MSGPRWVNLAERRPSRDDVASSGFWVVTRRWVDGVWVPATIPWYVIQCCVGPGIESIEWLEGAFEEGRGDERV